MKCFEQMTEVFLGSKEGFLQLIRMARVHSSSDNDLVGGNLK